VPNWSAGGAPRGLSPSPPVAGSTRNAATGSSSTTVPFDTSTDVDVRHPGTFVVVPIRAAVHGGAPLAGPEPGRPSFPTLPEGMVPTEHEPFPTGHGSGPPPVPGPPVTD